ncbi:MAG: NrsF family protein [Alphaproteobacteria bacterium]
MGAIGYALHCPEAALAFVATWYTAGIALAGALGAALGPRVLRW